MNLPRFLTNQTNKVQYRGDLKTWKEIVRSLTKADAKAPARLDMMGIIVYLACDDESKAKLRTIDTEKRLLLIGEDTDPVRTELICSIISTIAQETPSEKIQREMNFLNDIHQCKRGANETTESYANKFEAKVAKYVHQKNVRNTTDDQQRALQLLKNGKLSTNTRNSVTF